MKADKKEEIAAALNDILASVQWIATVCKIKTCYDVDEENNRQIVRFIQNYSRK